MQTHIPLFPSTHPPHMLSLFIFSMVLLCYSCVWHMNYTSIQMVKTFWHVFFFFFKALWGKVRWDIQLLFPAATWTVKCCFNNWAACCNNYTLPVIFKAIKWIFCGKCAFRHFVTYHKYILAIKIYSVSDICLLLGLGGSCRSGVLAPFCRQRPPS